jgi:excisionase family DNA binding protein
MVLMSPRQFTTREVAKQIGISPQTLYTWIAEKHIDAPRPIASGKRAIRLWTKAQVDKAKKFKNTLKRGVKKKK